MIQPVTVGNRAFMKLPIVKKICGTKDPSEKKNCRGGTFWTSKGLVTRSSGSKSRVVVGFHHPRGLTFHLFAPLADMDELPESAFFSAYAYLYI